MALHVKYSLMTDGCDKIFPIEAIEEEILTSRWGKFIAKLKLFVCVATQTFYGKKQRGV